MVSVVNNIGDQPYRLLAATIPLASCSLLAGAVITNNTIDSTYSGTVSGTLRP